MYAKAVSISDLLPYLIVKISHLHCNMPNINIIIFFFQLQAELREYRPTVDGNLETSALGLTFRVTKQGTSITRRSFVKYANTFSR